MRREGKGEQQAAEKYTNRKRKRGSEGHGKGHDGPLMRRNVTVFLLWVFASQQRLIYP